MDPGDGRTLLSVRGEAQAVVAPDQAAVFSTVTGTAESKAAAASAAAATLTIVLAELGELGGQPLSAQNTRNALTWSTHSMQTSEDYEHDPRTGKHRLTGRHRAAASVTVNVRDFALLDRVSAVLTRHDELEVQSVSWSVDDDNPAWATVRADAIHAALAKGQDYAVALGGSVVRVEHVADAGLLGGERSGWVSQAMGAAGRPAFDGGGADSVTLDPVPQLVSATIEARLSAVMPNGS